jgi:hypothetical protein
MVARLADLNFWDNGSTSFQCNARVTDAGSTTNYHYARISVPFERGNLGSHPAVTITPTVYATGGNSGFGNVCTAFYVSTTSGALSSGSSSVCTTGAYGAKTLSPNAITIGPGQGVLLDVAAQTTVQVNLVKTVWEAAGT